MANTDAYELDRDTPNLTMGYTKGDLIPGSVVLNYDPATRRAYLGSRAL
jgi:hypothetical protein